MTSAKPPRKDGGARAAPVKMANPAHVRDLKALARHRSKPTAVLPGTQEGLAVLHNDPGLLGQLGRVSSTFATLHWLLWRRKHEGAAALTPEEREWLGATQSHVDRDHALFMHLARRAGLGELPADMLAAVADQLGAPAWPHLVRGLLALADDRRIASDPRTLGLLGLFVQLARLAELAGSVAPVERAIDLAVGRHRANTPKRISGEDTRERVKAWWLADKGAERGRPGRCSKALRLKLTTVKSAVCRLRELGEIPASTKRTDD